VDIDMIAVTCPLLINGFSPVDARSAAVARLRRAAEAVAETIHPNDGAKAVTDCWLMGY